MKNKLNILIVIILSFLILSTPVKADIILTPYNGPYEATYGLGISEFGDGGPYTGLYMDEMKWFEINGIKYPAFCIDPGLPLGGGYQHTCKKVNKAGMQWLMNKAMSEPDILINKDKYSKYELAFRFYSVMIGYGLNVGDPEIYIPGYTGGLTVKKAPIIRFVQSSQGINLSESCKDRACSNNPYDYIYGVDSNGNKTGNNTKVDESFDLAKLAKEKDDQSSNSQETSQGSIEINKISDDGTTIKYSLTASGISSVELLCDKCTINTPSVDLSSGNAIIIVTPPTNCDEFTIKAYYVPSGTFTCSAEVTNQYQNLITKLDSGLVGGTSSISGTPIQTFTDARDGCGTCCRIGSESVNTIIADVHNCCYDNKESVVQEQQLDALFCKETTLGVEYYKKKCNISNFRDNELNNALVASGESSTSDYCEIYCTERVSVTVPEALKTNSNHFFELKEVTAYGRTSKSPVVESVKRCRMLINYEKWHNDHENIIKEEVKNYNKIQEYATYEKMYSDAKKTKVNETITIECEEILPSASKTCQGTCTKPVTEDDDETPTDDNSTPSNRGTTTTTTTTATRTTSYTCTETVTAVAKSSCKDAEHGLDSSTGKCKNRVITKKLSYDKYEFENKSYNTIKYNEHTNHNTMTISLAGDNTINAPETWKAWSDNLENDINQIKNDIKNEAKTNKETSNTVGSCKTGYTSSSGTVETKNSHWKCWIKNSSDETEENTENNKLDVEDRILNIPSKIANYKALKENAINDYNKQIENAKKMENVLNTCNNFFNTQQNFNFNPQLDSFEYLQIFPDVKSANRRGNTITKINFEDANCSYSVQRNGTIQDIIQEDRYSTSFGSSAEIVKDMQKIEDTSYTNVLKSYTNFYDNDTTAYYANKAFSTDALYRQVCSWEEKEQKLYSVGGRVDTEVSVTEQWNSFTYRYTIHTTTYGGIFDTRWNLKKLGTNGKFDQYFNNGNVCSLSTSAFATTNGPFHCGLENENKIIRTGGCIPLYGYTVGLEKECPKPSSDNLMIFKIIDTQNIFPACKTECAYSDSCNTGCDYAYNWLETSKGKTVIDKIQKDSKDGKTYSNEKISYQFTLTSNDLKTIKEYNDDKISSGGYSNTDMKCEESCNMEVDCIKIPGRDTCIADEACTKCKSTFIKNICDGKKIINSKSLTKGYCSTTNTIHWSEG